MQLLGAALALFSAAGAQEAPPDEGFEFVFKAPLWRGLEVRAGVLQGSGLRMNVSDPSDIQDDGITPPFRVSLELEEKDFEALSLGVLLDFDLFRLSIDFFTGDWKGEGVLTVENAPNPPVLTPVDVEGETWGFHFGIHWPALRTRSGPFEASLGPQLSVGWQHEELDPIAGDPVGVHHDEVNELAGRTGIRLAFLYRAGDAWFSLEGEAGHQVGSSVGPVSSLSAGIGFRF